MASNQKIVNLGLLLGGGALFLFLMNLTRAVWGLVGLRRMPDWILEPHVLIGLALAGTAALVVRRNETSNRYLNEVAQELSKVTWPSRKEAALSTGVSCVLVAVCAVVLFFYDSLWAIILRGVFSL